MYTNPSITAELARQHRTDLQHDANAAHLARLATKPRSTTRNVHLPRRFATAKPITSTIRSFRLRIGGRAAGHAPLGEPNA